MSSFIVRTKHVPARHIRASANQPEAGLLFPDNIARLFESLQSDLMKAARLTDWSTRRFVWLTVSFMVAAWLIDVVDWPLKIHFGIPYMPLEYLSTAMFHFGWCFLVLLLPVAAFRPDNRFYLRGDCGLRAKAFGFVLVANLAVFAAVIIMILVAFA